MMRRFWILVLLAICQIVAILAPIRALYAVFNNPDRASVAYPIGTAITICNDSSAGVLTLAITTDTLVWLPTGTTGSRTLAADGQATILKVTATRWQITGVGLT